MRSLISATLLLALASAPAQAQSWSRSWMAAPLVSRTAPEKRPDLSDRTLRQVVRISTGGDPSAHLGDVLVGVLTAHFTARDLLFDGAEASLDRPAGGSPVVVRSRGDLHAQLSELGGHLFLSQPS